MVKNDGTADSKERRHNGNGWRGVGRLGRAGKRAAGRRWTGEAATGHPAARVTSQRKLSRAGGKVCVREEGGTVAAERRHGGNGRQEGRRAKRQGRYGAEGAAR